MNATGLIDALARFPDVLQAAVADTPDSEARWRPPDGAWSILEIVCHLADEEVLDFRTRLERVLRDPNEAWPPIEPERWAVERDYNAQDIEDALARFLAERRASLTWLHGLRAPNWSLAHEHPRLGSMRAGDLLASWAAHDALHLRQIAKRRYQLVVADGGPFETRYAGQLS